MSCWASIATSPPSNTTWLTLFLSFYLKLLAFLPNHVALDSHRDIATSQYDVAHAFSPFCLRILASLPCHVVLDLQRDVAAFQHDVAPPFTQKTTRTIRVVAYLLYLNSKVQSSLKLDSSKRCSGKRRGPHELEPMPACL